MLLSAYPQGQLQHRSGELPPRASREAGLARGSPSAGCSTSRGFCRARPPGRVRVSAGPTRRRPPGILKRGARPWGVRAGDMLLRRMHADLDNRGCDHGTDAHSGLVALGIGRAETEQIVRPAWLAASRGMLWHVASENDCGLIIEVACGQHVWSPLKRALGASPPADPIRDVCATCASMLEEWPLQDPDAPASPGERTDRLPVLRTALDTSQHDRQSPGPLPNFVPAPPCAA